MQDERTDNVISTLRRERDAAREAVREYAQHNSWRCEYPPHWYHVNPSVVPEGDCPCGRNGTLRELGLS